MNNSDCYGAADASVFAVVTAIAVQPVGRTSQRVVDRRFEVRVECAEEVKQGGNNDCTWDMAC